MSNYDVLIIGAGAAGLMAAKKLSKNNKTVCILEARDRIGGRVHTINKPGFSTPIEAGAEFIHGKLPLTIKLLKQAGIKYNKTEGRFWQLKNNELKSQEDFIEHADVLTKKLNKLDKDISVAEFLKTFFEDDKYDDMKRSFRQYIEGYDAADINDASAFGIREEWEGEGDKQYRIDGGYGALLDKIKNDCLQKGCSIFLSNVIKEIRWTNENAEALTSNNTRFVSNKIIITVPPIFLTGTGPAGIYFNPALPQITKASNEIGYGGVVKILLEFSHSFWETSEGRKAKDFFFIFSREKIPTWWTQLPGKTPMLTGWLAGPHAKELSAENEDIILQHALNSLAVIFAIESKIIHQWIKGVHIHNWMSDPFCNGGYSYKSLTTEAAKNILRQPVSDTLFFASEALSQDNYGTVEAAFQSGLEVAEKILRLD